MSVRILVVEDDASDVYFLRRALENLEEDFVLEILADGERALQFIQNQRKGEKHPCVIVLDLHLPRHDGLEVLRALREEPVLSHIHVVVTTTIASPPEEAELRRMGADYWQKPRHLSEFEELATRLIEICKDLQVA
jgi:CheY-like chemotaxis protein